MQETLKFAFKVFDKTKDIIDKPKHAIPNEKPKEVNPLEDNMCPYHHLKLIYFCETCMLECCKICKEEKKCAKHTVKLLSDAS